MPIYEYYCEPCDRTYEGLYRIKDSPKSIQCRSCGGLADKVMSAFVTKERRNLMDLGPSSFAGVSAKKD